MFNAFVALLLVIIEVRALGGPVSCTPDVYSPDIWPGFDTYYSEGEKKCVVQYDACVPSLDCPLDLIKWWSPPTSLPGGAVKEARCFQGCSEIAYDNGVPTCLAEDRMPPPPCLHVWDDGAPRCLTDICGQPIPFCAAKGYCPGTGVFCFDSCVASGRVTWQDGVPHCDDLTTPCQQNGVSPVLAQCSNMPPPTGTTVSPDITCSSIDAPAFAVFLAKGSDNMIDLETGETMDFNAWGTASSMALMRQFDVDLWSLGQDSTWYLYSSGLAAPPMTAAALPNFLMGVATPLNALTCEDIMGAAGLGGTLPSPNHKRCGFLMGVATPLNALTCEDIMGAAGPGGTLPSPLRAPPLEVHTAAVNFLQPGMSYIVKTANDNVYALSWVDNGNWEVDGSVGLRWALVDGSSLRWALASRQGWVGRSGMSYLGKTASGNLCALSWVNDGAWEAD
ncbi:hypothetical protein JKP88DRAFT_285084 [Tribonema minus]|uniref:Uncharacterized protein n=1 Tax=Tribonema minus TaxID=303371 RepID=A0A836CQ39_9STRA|nr:hypothetical protein JKP88DRAFT_285084 [Tribonema minus]